MMEETRRTYHRNGVRRRRLSASVVSSSSYYRSMVILFLSLMMTFCWSAAYTDTDNDMGNNVDMDGTFDLQMDYRDTRHHKIGDEDEQQRERNQHYPKLLSENDSDYDLHVDVVPSNWLPGKGGLFPSSTTLSSLLSSTSTQQDEEHTVMILVDTEQHAGRNYLRDDTSDGVLGTTSTAKSAKRKSTKTAKVKSAKSAKSSKTDGTVDVDDPTKTKSAKSAKCHYHPTNDGHTHTGCVAGHDDGYHYDDAYFVANFDEYWRPDSTTTTTTTTTGSGTYYDAYFVDDKYSKDESTTTAAATAATGAALMAAAAFSERKDATTNVPSQTPSEAPSLTAEPTTSRIPSTSPSFYPTTARPTTIPSIHPSTAPTTTPSIYPSTTPTATCKGKAFINELHYRSIGLDSTEFVEIAHSFDYPLLNHEILFYDGDDGGVYKSLDLGPSTPKRASSYNDTGFVFTSYNVFSLGRQMKNGKDDGHGVALVAQPGNQVLDFVSYGRRVKAQTGPAAGMTSQNIRVTESFLTLPSQSLQLGGRGFRGDDFYWQESQRSTPGQVNTNQIFDCPDAVKIPNDFARYGTVLEETKVFFLRRILNDVFWFLKLY